MARFRALLLAFLPALGTGEVSWELHPAAPLRLPLLIDSNTPAYWREGKLHLLHSGGEPFLTRYDPASGNLKTIPVTLDQTSHLPMWFESAWVSPEGVVHAWYHHERLNVCPGSTLTVPEIGAAVSHDGGGSFTDLGVILSSGDEPDCGAPNGYFAGGHGDFSVVLSPDRRYFYFVLTNYGGEPSSQGIALARLPFDALASPAGAVQKYWQGSWSEPGLGGRVTPLLPAAAPWTVPNTDSFWGPSVHWNTHLERYVIIMNRSCCVPGWPQEAIYLSTAVDLATPDSWTTPVAILGSGEWYPWILGATEGESSSEAGARVRLFVRTESEWEIEFFGEPRAGQ